jgi:hypothetical protein
MPSLNALGLTCLSDPRYLGLGWLPSTSELGITCLSNPHYLGLGYQPSPSAELGTLLSPESIWVWLAPNPACSGLGTLSSPHLRHDHSFKCAKEWLDLKGFLSLLKICLSVAPKSLWYIDMQRLVKILGFYDEFVEFSSCEKKGGNNGWYTGQPMWRGMKEIILQKFSWRVREKHEEGACT